GNSTSNIRRAYGFEGGPGKAARLIINYRDDGSTVIGRTVRDELVSAVDALSAEGYTPIQDVMYEAAQYYRGGSVLYGGRRGGPPYTAPTTRSDGGPFRYTRVSHPDSLQSGTINTPASCSLSNYSASACATETITGNPQYKSPIEVSCQQNYVVLLTDGEANKPHSSSLIQSLINTTSCTGSGGEACVRNLAKWMYDNDMSSSVTGKQNIITHTIAFNLSASGPVNFLTQVAQDGGGSFYSANTAEELADKFTKIIAEAQQTNTSFVSAGTAVNAFNRSLNRDDMYITV